MKSDHERPKGRALIFVHPHFTLPGGAGNLILEIGKRLSKKRRVVMIAQTIRPEYVESYPEIEFRSLNGPTTGKLGFWLLLPYWRMRTHREITAVVEESGGDATLFANVFPAHWMALGYRFRGAKMKSVWFCHEPSAFIHIPAWRKSITNPVIRTVANLLVPILAAYDKKKVAQADTLFTNSEFGKLAASRVYGRDSVVVYPGVDFAAFECPPISEREDIVLTVGRLTAFKRVDLLVRAFSKLDGEKLRLVIVGDGEEKENLLKLIADLHEESRISVRSGISNADLKGLYALSKLFVLASEQEPFGMVILEAMAAGLPVIANDAGGPREIVVAGETGSLIALSEESLTNEMAGLLADAKRLEAYSMAARKRAETVFNWETASERVERCI